MISFSSPALGREKFARENFKENHKWNKLNYQNGDINTTVIKTYLGRTIMVQWDETSPRPYTRLNLIQGTNGVLVEVQLELLLIMDLKDILKIQMNGLFKGIRCSL